jgi:hypothetical protein
MCRGATVGPALFAESMLGLEVLHLFTAGGILPLKE